MTFTETPSRRTVIARIEGAPAEVSAKIKAYFLEYPSNAYGTHFTKDIAMSQMCRLVELERKASCD